MSKTLTRFVAGGSAALLALSVAGAAVAGDKPAGSRGTTLAINVQGKVVINHAEVTAVNAPSLTVKIYGTLWTVNTTADTKIVRHFGGSSGLGEYVVGDFVNVRGAIVDGQLAVNAVQLKNESTRAAAFRGTIASVTAPDTITVTVPNGAIRTVKVTSSTAIKVGDAVKTFAELAVGQKAQVKGYLNRASDVVTASSIAIRP